MMMTGRSGYRRRDRRLGGLGEDPSDSQMYDPSGLPASVPAPDPSVDIHAYLDAQTKAAEGRLVVGPQAPTYDTGQVRGPVDLGQARMPDGSVAQIFFPTAQERLAADAAVRQQYVEAATAHAANVAAGRSTVSAKAPSLLTVIGERALPWLVIGGVAYYLYRRTSRRPNPRVRTYRRRFS